MRKPNYRFERAERDRAKQAKKAEKLKRQQARTPQQDGEGEIQPDAAMPGSDPAVGDRE
jgi:hypothetical protein